MTVKTFKPVNPSELEKVLQDWLDQNPTITIHHIVQSQDGIGRVTVTILFTAETELQ